MVPNHAFFTQGQCPSSQTSPSEDRNPFRIYVLSLGAESYAQLFRRWSGRLALRGMEAHGALTAPRPFPKNVKSIMGW
jgi:hypothetical protein